MYIEHDPQNDRYFLKGQILSSTGSSSITLNEPMQKNGNILSTLLNRKMINYHIDKCKEPNYNPFIKNNNKNNKNYKNNKVNNELGTFLDLLNRETDILDSINKNNTNINLLQAFIINFDNSYKKLNDINKKEYEKAYTTFKSKIIEKIEIVIKKNQIKQLESNEYNLPRLTHQKLPTKTKLNKITNKFKNSLSKIKNYLSKPFRSPNGYTQLP